MHAHSYVHQYVLASEWNGACVEVREQLQGTDHVNSGWSQSPRDQISSASRLPGLKTCATMPNPSQNIPSI